MATQIERLAAEFAALRVEAEAVAKRKAQAEAALVDAMQSAHQKSIVLTDANGGECRQTLVEGETVKTDYEALEAKVDPKVWKTVLRTVVDPSLVEAAVALKKIKAEDVADVSEVKPRKPFIKVSGNYNADSLLANQQPRRKARVRK